MYPRPERVKEYFTPILLELKNAPHNLKVQVQVQYMLVQKYSNSVFLLTFCPNLIPIKGGGESDEGSIIVMVI